MGLIDISSITKPLFDQLDRIEKKQDMILEALKSKATPIAIKPIVKILLDNMVFPDVEPGEYTQAKHAILFGQNKKIRDDGDRKVDRRNGRTVVVHGYQKGLHGTKKAGMNEWGDILECQEIFIAIKVKPIGLGKGGKKKWSTTGKFFGFSVGNALEAATGGKDMFEKGASARIYLDEYLNAALGLYDHGKTGKHGHDGGEGKFTQFVSDEENLVVMRGVMNTGNNYDGILQVWHDDTLVCSKTDLCYRVDGVKPTGFTSVLLQTFTGGDEKDPQFAHPDSSEIEQSGMYIGIGNGDRIVYKETDVLELSFGKFGGKK